MQRVTLEELKHILYHAFRDHLTMKDIENIIINEEESLNETSGNCQTEFEGGGCLPGRLHMPQSYQSAGKEASLRPSVNIQLTVSLGKIPWFL